MGHETQIGSLVNGLNGARIGWAPENILKGKCQRQKKTKNLQLIAKQNMPFPALVHRWQEQPTVHTTWSGWGMEISRAQLIFLGFPDLAGRRIWFLKKCCRIHLQLAVAYWSCCSCYVWILFGRHIYQLGLGFGCDPLSIDCPKGFSRIAFPSLWNGPDFRPASICNSRFELK